MNPIRPLFVASLISILAQGCHSPSSASPPPAPAQPAPAAMPAAAPPPAPPVAAVAVDDPLTLRERLAREAATRPPGALPAEKVAAALSSAGVPLGQLQQVLARTLGARYCAVARTPSGLVVSLCEFEDDAQAARGVAFSRRTFDRLIPGRHLAHRRGTILTLASGAPDPTRTAEAARAAAAFAAL